MWLGQGVPIPDSCRLLNGIVPPDKAFEDHTKHSGWIILPLAGNHCQSIGESI